MPLALVIPLVLLFALVVGGSFVLGAPVLAVPILLVLLPGPFLMGSVVRRQLRRRQVARFREQAQARKTDFDARDEQTLV